MIFFPLEIESMNKVSSLQPAAQGGERRV